MILCGLANASWADPQSKSYSHWRLDGKTVDMVFTVPARELTRLPTYQQTPDTGHLLENLLLSSIHVEHQGKVCVARSPNPGLAEPGWLQYQLRFVCDAPIEQLEVRLTTLLPYVRSHLHFAQFQSDDQPPRDYLLTASQPEIRVDLHSQNTDSNNTLWRYLQFGFEHILIGLDHIVFLLGLLLLTTRLRQLLAIVTGFTLGHSVTLSLAALGWVIPNGAWVEAMIGFTIALVAAENIAVQTGSTSQTATAAVLMLAVLMLWSLFSSHGPSFLSLTGLDLFCGCYLRLSCTPARAQAWRPAITTVFGLIHGFGFAAVLSEVGLPQTHTVLALVGFNLGVELGQIVIVLVLVLGGWLLSRCFASIQRRLLSDSLSAALCGLGVFWFVQRSPIFMGLPL